MKAQAPHRDKNQFGRAFHIVRKRAGVSPDVTFQDLRITALTEQGSKSAMNAEIVSFSGHAVNSLILQEYIMQTKETALNAHRKMGNYLKDENGAKTPGALGMGGVKDANLLRGRPLKYFFNREKWRE
jgi:hypothetical protein